MIYFFKHNHLLSFGRNRTPNLDHVRVGGVVSYFYIYLRSHEQPCKPTITDSPRVDLVIPSRPVGTS